MTTVVEALADASLALTAAGCDSPRLDAELLVGHALGMSRAELHAHSADRLDDERLERIDALVLRRARREPVAYILGSWGFRHLDLAVDRRVLVPRPETEQLVDVCLELLEGRAAPRILDVGTGSGAIALALATEVPESIVTAVDVSAVALELAAANGARVGARVEWIESDLLAALAGRTFDLIVSNPPYVPISELRDLEPEVRDWEPWLATTPGADGLATLRAVAAVSLPALDEGGRLALECGYDQAAAVAADLEARGYRHVAVHRDLAGVERFVTGGRA